MLDWSAGPLKAADALSLPLNEGISCLDEPPETPAHVFAFRAFKTAIFGTPHPEAQPRTRHTPAESANATATPPPKSRTPRATESKLAAVEASNQHTRDQAFARLISPTKGILLTPGIGASRRKNVSFMQNDTNAAAAESEHPQEEELPSQDNSPTRKSHQRDRRSRPTTLTRTLLELSKQNPGSQDSVVGPTPRVERHTASPIETKRQLPVLEQPIQMEPDHTLDLSKPHSRSGQHWKTQYDQYFERSSRELRQVIQYGQNVKSYAAKKDTEASKLAEQLRSEQARMEAMERKIARLTKRLDVAQAEDNAGEGDHARLVANIAQQSAMAAKYRKEYEELRERLGNMRSGESIHNLQAAGGNFDHEEANEQMQQLKEAAQSASDQAQRLEAENLALKQSLARVKQEMMSYESRRLAREEKLKQREQKHKAAKEAAEVELQRIQAGGANEPAVGVKAPGQAQQKELPSNTNGDNPNPESIRSVQPDAHSLKENRPIRPTSNSISPRKRRSRAPVDIWTMESPLDNGTLPHDMSRSQTSALPPSSVRHDIEKTLKEINQNIAPSFGSGPPIGRRTSQLKGKEPIGYEDGQPIWPDTSTALPEQVWKEGAMSSPAKLQASLVAPSAARPYSGATTGRSASMLSGGHVGRTASLHSNRSKLTMTAERKAATRARLAQKSAEKERGSALR